MGLIFFFHLRVSVKASPFTYFMEYKEIEFVIPCSNELSEFLDSFVDYFWYEFDCCYKWFNNRLVVEYKDCILTELTVNLSEELQVVVMKYVRLFDYTKVEGAGGKYIGLNKIQIKVIGYD